MIQVKCSCGDYFFASFLDETLCGKCRGCIEARRTENDTRPGTPPSAGALPITTTDEEDRDTAFNASLNATITHLRMGQGELVPTFHVVIMQNVETQRCVVLLTTPDEERAGHMAAVIEKAVAGKNIGFTLRVEAVAVDAAMPSLIALTGKAD